MENEKSIIYFITSNNHKFNEVSKIFQNENIKYNLKQLDIETIEIQANTIKDVALFKLNSVKEVIKDSFFVEDAGFFVDYPLNGFPGIYSSYVFKTIGNEGILKLIDNFENSKAHFSALIALYFKPTNKIFIFEGEVKGSVSDKIRGDYGFGFDPIFIPHGSSNKTFGELSIEEKNHISHRGRALKQLIILLKESHNS
jgi:XTP/dITP diphosphohydrolase